MSPPLLTLLGGDRRQLVCANLLMKAGYRVAIRGIDNVAEDTEPLATCTAVVLPLPWGRGDLIHTPLWGGSLSVSQVFAKLNPTCHVFAGQVDDVLRAVAGSHPLHDYAQYEPLAIAGAIATAEGAISVALHCLPCTLWQTSIAILGFGRIAKVLAHRLRGMGAEVTVFARKESDRAWASAYGYRTYSTADLSRLSDVRVIFNTAPALLLDNDALAFLSPDTLYIELASLPGINTDAARARKIRIEPALGLPGKHFPESAGRALAETLLTLLKQEEILP